MRRTYVPPSGNRDAKMAIVGEQPGPDEIRAKPPQPFVGAAGRGLDECLMLTKIPRRSIYLSNVIKDLDAPLAHYINIDSRGKSSISQEGYEYIRELGEELKSLNPNVVVATGNVPLLALANRLGITKWRGSVLESTLVPGLKIIPTFHPATFIPPKFNFLNKPLICEDLQRAYNESEFPEIRRMERKLHIKMSFNEAVAILNHCYEYGKRGQTIGLDIEVLNGELDCLSVAWSMTEGASIPFKDHNGDYFSIEQEFEIMLLVAKIVQDPDIAKAGANFIFDTQYLLHKYGIVPRGPLQCTQIAQKIAFPDFNAGLDFVTTMHTDIPYYKADGKQWMKMQAGTWNQWWNYSAMDAVVPVEAIPKQMQVLEKQGNLKTYERQRKLIKPLIYMAERGIKIDVDKMEKYREEQQVKLDELAEQLNEVVGYNINYNSPQQLMKYFYDELKIKPYKKRNAKGQYTKTIDVDALKRIARRNYKAAQIMLDIRSLTKRISTYLNIGKVDKDGRYRSSYKPVGAETGRLSSGETIFGTGGNQQNWPHDLLRFFCFDEGYIGYSIDLSQIENRIVAYVGGVISQIEAFEKGIDLHRLTASVIFNKPYNEISGEDGSSPLGDGRQSERYWGKKCKFNSCDVLSEAGWISISKAYELKCKIAQWDSDNNISFEYPIEWYVDHFEGESVTIDNQRIYQEATPEHKMPLIYEDGRIIDKPISKYPKSGKYKAPLSGTYSGKVSLNKYVLMLMVAFQADGHWNNDSMQFHLCKERKINRLKMILDNGGFKYSGNNTISISAKDDVCKFIKIVMGDLKLYGSWLLELDQESLKVIIDELYHWDGYTDGTKKQYFTTHIANAIWIQTIAHLCKKAAIISHQDNSTNDSFGTKMLYRLTIRDSISPATHAINKRKRFKSEKIYCPTMPSGYFLCREHGLISITGNSNHATNYDVTYKTFALKNEMPEAEAKQVLEQVHKGYPQIRGGYHEVIKNMLFNNRTVVNLYGRTRLFFGPIIPSYPNIPKSACYDTYRQAYAHLPQSTCADKINEYGLEYIYYNQDLFKPVELLAQIHDSVVFQIPLSIPWTEHARMILAIKDSLEIPLKWHDSEIPTPADLCIGYNMCKDDMAELKSKEIPNDKNLLADKLKDISDKLNKD